MVNAFGIIPAAERERIEFGRPRQAKGGFDGHAVVETGEHDGQFFWGYKFDLCDQGAGFAPGPGELDHYVGDFRQGVSSREAAEERGLLRLKERLVKIAERERTAAAQQAERLVELIDGRRQLSLF